MSDGSKRAARSGASSAVRPTVQQPRPGWKVKLVGLVVGILVAFLLLEILLRFFNPFVTRVEGDRIVLQSNTTYRYENTAGLRGVADEIVHHKNSLGFRGPEPPEDFDSRYKILAVGGSTTECAYATEGRTWTDRLQDVLGQEHESIWVNNAGLDGHSTFGHRILLRDHVLGLEPDMVLLLIGRNDVGRDDLAPHEREDVDEPSFALDSPRKIAKWLGLYLKSVELAGHLYRAVTNSPVGHQTLDLEVEPSGMSEAELEVELERHAPFVEAFRERSAELVDTCLEAGITPVLITQPMLFGPVVDPSTGVDLGAVHDGRAQWAIQDLYNDALRELASEAEVLLIDLATELSKDSLYFYDGVHFTEAGCHRVGSIVAARLVPVIPR